MNDLEMFFSIITLIVCCLLFTINEGIKADERKDEKDSKVWEGRFVLLVFISIIHVLIGLFKLFG